MIFMIFFNYIFIKIGLKIRRISNKNNKVEKEKRRTYYWEYIIAKSNPIIPINHLKTWIWHLVGQKKMKLKILKQNFDGRQAAMSW